MSLILVVDDSRFSRRAMRQALEECGHVVEEACNGAEALARYAERGYDLVTLDLLMPVMDGLTTLKKLREINPALKIIVATADIQSSTRDEVEKLGAAALINKPIDRDQLKRVVASIAERNLSTC